MKVAVAAGAMLILAACGRTSPAPASLTTPAPPGAPSPAPTAARVISLGEEIKDTLTFHGADKFFELTAPSDGTLIVRLSWDARQGRLELGLADTQFAHFPENRSPIVGQLPVLVGGKYRVRVADGAPWDYDGLFVAFDLTTSME